MSSTYNWASWNERNMACLIPEYGKFKVSEVFSVLKVQEVNISEIHRTLQTGYGPEVLSWKEINVCVKNIKIG